MNDNPVRGYRKFSCKVLQIYLNAAMIPSEQAKFSSIQLSAVILCLRSQ